MKTLVTPKDNSKALRSFRAKLREIAGKPKELEWRFPNGSRGKYPTYLVKTYLDKLEIGVPEGWEARNPHLIRFAQRQGPLSPDVELNIPEAHNRRVSGLYAKHANGEIWLCSRGLFTAFRGKIKRDISFSHFEKWLYEIDDEEKLLQIIPVCSLSSPTIFDDIADFTDAVRELKEIYKDEDESYKIISPKKTNKDSPKLAWRDNNEFEGMKSSGDKISAEYQYMHGPLCNQLKISLEKSLKKNKNFVVGKNKHIDAAIVTRKTKIAHSIFEVKTAPLPSSQIYTAVGQLLYYKTLYGDPNTHLYLVLPLDCESFDTEKFIEELEMQVIYGKSGKFTLPNGEEYIVSV